MRRASGPRSPSSSRPELREWQTAHPTDIFQERVPTSESSSLPTTPAPPGKYEFAGEGVAAQSSTVLFVRGEATVALSSTTETSSTVGGARRREDPPPPSTPQRRGRFGDAGRHRRSGQEE